MNTRLPRLAVLVVILAGTNAFLSPLAQSPADLVSATGSAQTVEPPPSLAKGAWESNVRTRVFNEQRDFLLQHDIEVNITTAGVYRSPDDYTPGIIPAGTTVDSWFLHQDAKGWRNRILLHGSLTFDQNIIGVMVDDESLDATDGIFGRAGVLYPTGLEPKRCLDFPLAQDRIRISDDCRTLYFDLQTKVALDHIRVLTAAIPAPGSLALLLAAGLTAAHGRRRRA